MKNRDGFYVVRNSAGERLGEYLARSPESAIAAYEKSQSQFSSVFKRCTVTSDKLTAYFVDTGDSK